MEDVLERPSVAKVDEKKVDRSYNKETHPYLTPEFWLDEKNQFWKRKPQLYRQEAYEHILDQCRAELKENLIN